MATQNPRPAYRIGTDLGALGQWKDRTTGFALLPALSVMVLERIKVGFRILGKGTLFGMFFLMMAVSWFHNLHFSLWMGFSHGNDESLAWFAVLSLMVGLWQRWQRKKEIKRGEPEPTFSHGYSRLTFLPIRDDLIYRFVDPAVTLVVGAVLYSFGLGLGLWLIVSAIAFAIVEHAVHLKSEEQFLNDLDAGYDAKMRAETMSRFDSKVSATRPTEGTGTNVATGADAQLAAEIEKRRKTNNEGRIQ